MCMRKLPEADERTPERIKGTILRVHTGPKVVLITTSRVENIIIHGTIGWEQQWDKISSTVNVALVPPNKV